MEEVGNTKEVLFGNYCGRCKYKNVPENNEPCEECLSNPSRIDSHKPLKFEKGVSSNGRHPNKGQ